MHQPPFTYALSLFTRHPLFKYNAMWSVAGRTTFDFSFTFFPSLLSSLCSLDCHSKSESHINTPAQCCISASPAQSAGQRTRTRDHQCKRSTIPREREGKGLHVRKSTQFHFSSLFLFLPGSPTTHNNISAMSDITAPLLLTTRPSHHLR